MKRNLRRLTWLTTLVTLLPIIVGWLVYPTLPAQVATHFNFHGSADAFANKAFVVFGLPLLMALLQLLLTGIYRFSLKHAQAAPKMEPILFSVIPLVTYVAYFATLGYNLGLPVDMRHIVVALVALMFIMLGNYLPTVPYSQQRYTHLGWGKRTAADWTKYSRAMGYTMVITGILLFLSLLFSAWVSIVILAAFFLVTIYLILHLYLGQQRNHRGGNPDDN
ncbi:MAG: DUF1648 domain-containing protein [Lactobacillus sp.]|nr:DUF1648 domain-containing protein [Lactobacillus sp.]